MTQGNGTSLNQTAPDRKARKRREEALKREIKEELDADIEVKEYVGENEFHYPEKDVKLIFYKAELISDGVKLLEHEDYKWIKIEEASKYDFAEADKKVLEWLK